jgi:hypothetical protein
MYCCKESEGGRRGPYIGEGERKGDHRLHAHLYIYYPIQALLLQTRINASVLVLGEIKTLLTCYLSKGKKSKGGRERFPFLEGGASGVGESAFLLGVRGKVRG